MNIKKVKLNDILPAEYNPRIITPQEYEKLSKSIQSFGFVDPIIINLKNNRIIGGHQRYKVLQDSGISEVNLIELGDIGWCFTDEKLTIKSDIEEKALNVALNKISGEWDNSKLDSLLESLSENENFELTGFEKLDDISIDDLNLEDYAYTTSEDDMDFYEPEDSESYGEDDDEEYEEEEGDNYEELDHYNYSYVLYFSTEEIQEKWFQIIDFLKHKYDEDISITTKLLKFLKS